MISSITRKDYQEWHGGVRGEQRTKRRTQTQFTYRSQAHLAGPLIDGLLVLLSLAYYQERKEDEILYGYGGKTLESYRGAALDAYG